MPGFCLNMDQIGLRENHCLSLKKNAGCFRGLVNYDVVGMIDLTGKIALLIGEYGRLLNLLGSMLIMNSPIVQIR